MYFIWLKINDVTSSVGLIYWYKFKLSCKLIPCLFKLVNNLLNNLLKGTIILKNKLVCIYILDNYMNYFML